MLVRGSLLLSTLIGVSWSSPDPAPQNDDALAVALGGLIQAFVDASQNQDGYNDPQNQDGFGYNDPQNQGGYCGGGCTANG